MARYFIDRPIFAWVISLAILLSGFIALRAFPAVIVGGLDSALGAAVAGLAAGAAQLSEDLDEARELEKALENQRVALTGSTEEILAMQAEKEKEGKKKGLFGLLRRTLKPAGRVLKGVGKVIDRIADDDDD